MEISSTEYCKDVARMKDLGPFEAGLCSLPAMKELPEMNNIFYIFGAHPPSKTPQMPRHSTTIIPQPGAEAIRPTIRDQRFQTMDLTKRCLLTAWALAHGPLVGLA
jgi:hypothetical protein